MTSVFGSTARGFNQLHDVDPWALEQYLELAGWQREEWIVGLYGTWIAPRSAASVLLPHDPDLSDYQLRFAEAMEILERFTGLSGEALALEIISARKDVFLLRADQVTVDASIPFREGQKLINGVHDLLLTAAATTVRPRASTAGRKPAIVHSFMNDDVRLGHTLHGSFVITVLAGDAADESRRRSSWERGHDAEAPALSSLPEMDERESSLQEGEAPGPRQPDKDDPKPSTRMASFSREVMETLAQGLTAADRMAAAPNITPLDDYTREGVTVQLLQTVGEMAEHEGLRSLEMTFKWSSVEDSVEPVTRVDISREEARTLGRVAERFKQVPEVIDERVLGTVVRLDRAEGSEEGMVVVDGLVGEDRRRVRVPLSGEAYRLAIGAHETGDPVIATGVMLRRPRGWRMAAGAELSIAKGI